VLEREQADAADDVGELGGGDAHLVLDALGEQLAVVGELSVDEPRREHDVADLEHGLILADAHGDGLAGALLRDAHELGEGAGGDVRLEAAVELLVERGLLDAQTIRVGGDHAQALRLTFTEGTLALSAQTPDVGEASESIPVPFRGDTFEIGFNPDFLRDGLESVESDELVLKLISPLRPGLIESPEPGEFVYLLMPIRLNV
jgi:hypothetical protein